MCQNSVSHVNGVEKLDNVGTVLATTMVYKSRNDGIVLATSMVYKNKICKNNVRQGPIGEKRAGVQIWSKFKLER